MSPPRQGIIKAHIGLHLFQDLSQKQNRCPCGDSFETWKQPSQQMQSSQKIKLTTSGE